jgi:hypothetical protein
MTAEGTVGAPNFYIGPNSIGKVRYSNDFFEIPCIMNELQNGT